MNELLKKFTEELKGQLAANLATKEMQEVIAGTKANSDSGSFKFIASTPTIDRQGESIDQNGWELEHYKNNPVLLWAHDYTQPPIGVVDEIVKENGNLVIIGRFAPTEFGQQIRKLYDANMVNTVSVGFIPKEMNGNIITKAELLEVSVVPVPANPQALSVRQLKEMGIEPEFLKTKGFEIETTDPVKEEKGAVADRLAAMQSMTWDIAEEKWSNVNEIYAIIEAFCGVYLQPETKPEQFAELLNETAGLLVSMANGESMDEQAQKEIIAAAVKSEMFKNVDFRKEKAGRVLSEKNRTVIKSTIDSLTATKEALQSLYDETSLQGEEKIAEPLNEGEEKQKNANNLDSAAMHEWLLQKQVMGAIVTALSEAGANINKKIKSQK